MPGRNALLDQRRPGDARGAAQPGRSAFDIDVLAGQSYALFPVTSGDAKDFATALTEAMRAGKGAALAGVVRVVPMERINSVLVVSGQPRYIDDARRVYALVERSAAADGAQLERLLPAEQPQQRHRLRAAAGLHAQPRHGGAERAGGGPRRQRAAATGQRQQRRIGGGTGRPGGTAVARRARRGQRGAGSRLVRGGRRPRRPGSSSVRPRRRSRTRRRTRPTRCSAASSPTGGGDGGRHGQADDRTRIRIIPNAQNNAILIYATPQERDTIEAMLRKIDILPLQVRIDATIAEVTLNDNLQYGTQFFFKAGGINGALNFSPAGDRRPACSPAASPASC